MARDLVINEYTDRRAQLHNEWVSKSRLFNNSMLPYPAIPPYPTELEILDRAQLLLNFLNIGQAAADFVDVIDSPTQPDTEVDSTQIALVIDDADEVAEDLQTQQLEEIPEQSTVESMDQVGVEETEKESIIDADKLVPSMIKRLGQIRKSWN